MPQYPVWTGFTHTHKARGSLLNLGQPLFLGAPIGKLYVLRTSTLGAGPVA
jgi:hypothetical protein